MNPHAAEFIPSSSVLALWDMPFFQQRLERFFLAKRIRGAAVEDLVLTRVFPSLQTVQPTQKDVVVFLATWKGFNLRYEAKANKWNDPRFGVFIECPNSP
jgi:hypothetical protein